MILLLLIFLNHYGFIIFVKYVIYIFIINLVFLLELLLYPFNISLFNYYLVIKKIKKISTPAGFEPTRVAP